MTITRRRVLKITAGIAAGSAFASLPGVAQAATNWDFADEYGENGLTGKTALYFIKEVEKRVGDELKITYQGGGALGYKSVDQFDAVGDGAVPMAITLVTQLGGIDPLFDLTSLPFLVQTPDDARTLWDISRPEYSKIFEANGQNLLFAVPNPPSGIHSAKPIKTPADLDGLRIRTYDVNGTKTLAAAGAAPLQIAWADLVPQLSTGAISAVLTSADGGVQLSIWDYLKDFSALNYAMGLFMAHVNKDAYEGLSDKARAAIEEVVPMTNDFAWQAMKDSIGSSYKIMRDHGMTVDTNPPDAVFERLKNAGSSVRDAWVSKVGDRGQAILDAFEKKTS